MKSHVPRRADDREQYPSEVERLGRGHQPRPHGRPRRLMANPIAIFESILLPAIVNALRFGMVVQIEGEFT